jgi:hypothetical protein
VNAAGRRGHHGPAGHKAPGEVVTSLVCENWSLRHREETVDCTGRGDGTSSATLHMKGGTILLVTT